MKHVDMKDFYQSAEELKITGDERNRLIGVAKHLEEDASPFNMPTWENCIKGHMYLGTNNKPESPSLYGLFGRDVPTLPECWKAAGVRFPTLATRQQAVAAIKHFLAYGH